MRVQCLKHSQEEGTFQESVTRVCVCAGGRGYVYPLLSPLLVPLLPPLRVYKTHCNHVFLCVCVCVCVCKGVFPMSVHEGVGATEEKVRTHLRTLSERFRLSEVSASLKMRGILS